MRVTYPSFTIGGHKRYHMLLISTFSCDSLEIYCFVHNTYELIFAQLLKKENE